MADDVYQDLLKVYGRGTNSRDYAWSGLEVWPESHWPGFALREGRIQDLYGMVVHVIRCNTHYAIDNRR